MIQILMLIAGIGLLIDLPSRRRRTPHDYPGVDTEKFRLWHEADLAFVKRFVGVTWGTAAVQFCLGLAAGALVETGNLPVGAAKATLVLNLALFLAAGAYLLDCRKRVLQLRKAAGIDSNHAKR